MAVRRVHEAPPELVKARIQQRRYVSTYSSADVLRSSAGAPKQHDRRSQSDSFRESKTLPLISCVRN